MSFDLSFSVEHNWYQTSVKNAPFKIDSQLQALFAIEDFFLNLQCLSCQWKSLSRFQGVIVIYCVWFSLKLYVFSFHWRRHTSLTTYGLRYYGHQWVLETGLLWRQKLLNEIPQQGVRWVTRAFNQVPTDSRWPLELYMYVYVYVCVCSFTVFYSVNLNRIKAPEILTTSHTLSPSLSHIFIHTAYTLALTCLRWLTSLSISVMVAAGPFQYVSLDLLHSKQGLPADTSLPQWILGQFNWSAWITPTPEKQEVKKKKEQVKTFLSHRLPVFQLPLAV